MRKNRRTATMAVLATATALALGGGTAAAMSGGTDGHPVFDHPGFGPHGAVRHAMVPEGALGVVTSVNGLSTAGSCGTAASAGSFTLKTWRDAVSTVDVTNTSTFVDPAASPASFADVCVGDVVGAAGPVSGSTVTAGKVFVVPPRSAPVRRGAFGLVSSVNGVNTAGACGTADSSGTFTLTAWKHVVAGVDVTSTTTFVDSASSPASFANVCVGAVVGAVGTVADGRVMASKVFVVPPPVPTPPPTHPTPPAPAVTSVPVAPATGSSSSGPAAFLRPPSFPTHSSFSGAPAPDPVFHPGAWDSDGHGPGAGRGSDPQHGSGLPNGGPGHGPGAFSDRG